jgi:hypothetical protein
MQHDLVFVTATQRLASVSMVIVIVGVKEHTLAGVIIQKTAEHMPRYTTHLLSTKS